MTTLGFLSGQAGSVKKHMMNYYRRVMMDMHFGEALKELQAGGRLVRKGWNAKGLWIELQFPDQNSKMTRPYIYMSCPRGSTNHFGNQMKELEKVPWLPSQTDLLAEDWEIKGGL